MDSLSQQDLDVRLQLSGIAYTDFMSKYLDSLKWGKKSSKLEQTKLQLLGIYIELLLAYNIDSLTNCMTEIEAQLVCDNISKLTNVCFQPLGFNYTAS